MAVLGRVLRRRGLISEPLSRTFSCSETGSKSSSSPSRLLTSNKAGILQRASNEKNIHWVFLGCPGVGKGTYASRLSNLIGVPHIATGDLVREEAASSSPLAPQVCFRGF